MYKTSPTMRESLISPGTSNVPSCEMFAESLTSSASSLLVETQLTVPSSASAY
jgi:hypothetical protein